MAQTMWKTTIVQVLLCLYFINSICYAGNTLDDLTSPKSLSYLKDVTVWNDKKNTSLREILGDNLATENVDKNMVTDLAFMALCCSYTTKLLDFINASYWIFKKYGIVEDYSPDENTVEWVKNGIEYLRSNWDTILNMFVVIRHYSKEFDLNIDKNFSNVIMSINILFNNKSYKFVNRSISYIKSALELYNNEYCSMPKLENHDFSKELEGKCNENEEEKNKIVCLLKKLDAPILTSVWFPYEIKLDEVTQVQQMFDPANYMLTDFINTQVVDHKESTSIKHFEHSMGYVKTAIKEVHDYVSSSFQGEHVFKYQMLVVEYTGALMMCLIAFMINSKSPEEQQIRFNDSNNQLFKSYNQAVQALESLRPASMIGTVLKDLRHHTLFAENKQHVMQSINFYFKYCAFDTKEIKDFINSVDNQLDYEEFSAIQIAGFLDNIVKSLQLMAPNLFAVIETGHEPTENMFPDVVFITDDHIEDHTQINVLNKLMDYCKYSESLADYITQSDVIMSNCRTSEIKEIENNEKIVENCLSDFKSHLGNIRPHIKKIFNEIIKSISESYRSYLFAAVSHRLLEALYSITLYLDNDYWNEDTNVQDNVQYVETVVAKIKEMNRAHRTIIFILELFSNGLCLTESFRDNLECEPEFNPSSNKVQCKERMKHIYKQFIENIKKDYFDMYSNTESDLDSDVDSSMDISKTVNESYYIRKSLLYQILGDSNTEEQLCSEIGNIKIDDDGEEIKSKTEIDDNKTTESDDAKVKKILSEDIENKHVDSVSNELKSEEDDNDNGSNFALYREFLERSKLIRQNSDLTRSIDNYLGKSDEDKWNLNDDDTLEPYDQFQEPTYFLFENVIKNKSEQHCELSKILNSLLVAWYGKMSNISDIYDFVKNQVNVKYVYEYLLKFQRMILFMTYEKTINVIQTIGDIETKTIDNSTQNDIKQILRDYYSSGYPGVQLIYRRISQFFNLVSPGKPYDAVDISNIITCLKTEQSNLGIEFNGNYKEGDTIPCKIDLTDIEILMLLSDEQKIRDSKSEEFEPFDINSDKPNYEEDENQKSESLGVISGEDNSATPIEIDEKVLDSINQLKLYNYIVKQFSKSYNDVYSNLLRWNNINVSSIYKMEYEIFFLN